MLQFVNTYLTKLSLAYTICGGKNLSLFNFINLLGVLKSD